MVKKIDWMAVRAAYESGQEPFTRIAIRFGVSDRAIRRRAANEEWVISEGNSHESGESPVSPESPVGVNPFPPKQSRSNVRILQPDAETLDKIVEYAELNCHKTEVATMLGVSKVTLIRFFADYPEVGEAWARGKEEFKLTLRRLQLRLAKEGSASVAIFLGKNYLGQADTVKHDHGSLADAIRDAATGLDDKVADFAARSLSKVVPESIH
jgi:hypothetical protein